MCQPIATANQRRGVTLPAFGKIDPERVVAQDDLFVVVFDKYPVSPGHSLIIVKRAASRFHALHAEEKLRLMHWIDWCFEHLHSALQPDGFNIGLNDGLPHARRSGNSIFM
jgi:diadenosine tetraphosphate (Ap4A) HIT family hydrolase